MTTNTWLEIKDYLIITLGVLCYAVGFTIFLVPHEITTGGTTGLGAVLFYATGWWKVQYTFFLCNAILMLFALKTLSWRFCVKTIFAIAMLTLMLTGVEMGMQQLFRINPDLFPAGFNERVHLPITIENAFMSCVFGACMMGIGIGLVLLRNASTGGTDVIAAIINKSRDISLGTLVLISDIVIVSTSLLLPTSNLENLLYGYTTLIVVSGMIDYVVNSGRQSVQFLIFSERYEEIASAINELHRGVTVLNGQGWYTKQERKVLVVLAKKSESTTIFRIIHSVDPSAFVSQTLASGVFGYGFDPIKVKPKPAKPRQADPGKPRN
ncbi:MAG: YitT family protein [Bacteroidaceae bacterium]|nr:YitT family protein [Bacteroidaceae bacterium]